jgi:diacylglycerol kinase family enzyme
VKIPVVLNRGAGAAEQAEMLTTAFRGEGREIEILECSGEEIGDACRRAAEGPSPLVVAAGGDGTVSAVAGKLAGTRKELAVVPIGTLNHFARDMGIPLDPKEAARTSVCGSVARIDVGEVNGRVFVNNSSLGFYPSLVYGRDWIRRRQGRGKWSALIRAGLSLWGRCPNVAVRLSTSEGVITRRTPLVFVGNNRYELTGWSLGSRPQLDEGRLFVCVAPGGSPWRMVGLALRALFSRRRAPRGLEKISVSELWIDGPASPGLVSADGEVHRMDAPLHYRIRPAALSVRVPAPA